MKVTSYPLQRISDYVQYLNGTVKDADGIPYVFMYPYGLPEGTDITRFVRWHEENALPHVPIPYEFAYVDLGNKETFKVKYSLDEPFVSYNPMYGFSFNGTFKGTLNIEVNNMRITSLNSFLVTRSSAPYDIQKRGAMEYVNLIGEQSFQNEETLDYTTNFQPQDCSGAFERCTRLKKTPDNLNWDILSLHHHYTTPPYNPIRGHLMGWFASGCTSLEEVPSYKNAPNRYDATNTILFDTEYNHASMQQMCESCRMLRSFGPVLDFTKTDMTITTEYYGDANAPIFAGIFAGCTSLTDVRIKGLHGKDFDFTQGHFEIPNIDKDSIEYILNNVIDDGSAHTLTFSNIHQAEVSTTAIASAEAKNFTVEWVEYYDRFSAFNGSDWVFNTAQQPDMVYTLEDEGRTLSLTKFKPNRWIVRTNNETTTVSYLCGQTAGWTVLASGLNDNSELFAVANKFYQHSEVGSSGNTYGSVLGVGILPSSMQIAGRTSWYYPTENANCTQGQLIELPFTGYAWDSMTYTSGSTVQLGSELTALRGNWSGAGYNAYGKVSDGRIKVMPDWSSFPTPYGNWQSTIGIYTNGGTVDADGYITLEKPIKISLIKEKVTT